MIHRYFTPVLIALLCMYGGKISAKEISVQSPDGKLKVNIELKDKIYYSVYSGSDLLIRMRFFYQHLCTVTGLQSGGLRQSGLFLKSSV